MYHDKSRKLQLSFAIMQPIISWRSTMKYYECFALIAELSRNKIYLKHKLYYTGMTQKDQGMTHKDTSQLHFNFDFIQNFRYNISIHCNKL